MCDVACVACRGGGHGILVPPRHGHTVLFAGMGDSDSTAGQGDNDAASSSRPFMNCLID